MDESGDMGWKFDAPYRKGGSSRFLTIAFAICSSGKSYKLDRIVKKIYEKRGLHFKDTEIKGSSLTIEEKEYIARMTADMMEKNPEFSLIGITVDKRNVAEHIRKDSNKLYNYMIQMALLKHVAQYDEVNLIRDNRTVKVASGNSLIDYLQTYMWFELKASTVLNDLPLDSKSTRKLIFIDWMNNIIWGRYEDENCNAYNILKPHLHERKLFFRKRI